MGYFFEKEHQVTLEDGCKKRTGHLTDSQMPWDAKILLKLSILRLWELMPGSTACSVYPETLGNMAYRNIFY